jgi:SPP1 family predicted phage head-tail adaptor
MQIGKLRQRVTIQAATSADDVYGQPHDTWADVATYWAQVKTEPKGRLRVVADGVLAEVDHTVIFRGRVNVANTNRLTWRGKVLRVLSASNPDTLRIETHVRCIETV